MRINASGTISNLPTCLCHSGNLTCQRKFPEAKPAKLKLPHKSPRATTTSAPVVITHSKLRLSITFFYKCLLSQFMALRLYLFLCKRYTNQPQQLTSFIIVPGRRNNCNIHALSNADIIRIYLRENCLVRQANTVIAKSVKRIRR